MFSLLTLIGLIPLASAESIEQLGAGSPGISEMWANLKQVFPHTDVGSGGLALILLIITNLILKFIGGIAVLFIVYGGIKMVMSFSDENGYTEAKKVVIYAAVGLILTIMTDAIILYVMNLVETAAG